MSHDAQYERVLASLHDAAFDYSHCPRCPRHGSDPVRTSAVLPRGLEGPARLGERVRAIQQ